MNSFTYQYPVRQHFGKGCAENAIKEEMKLVGRNVLLAYGGGSLKRTGLYDKVVDWLHECGKDVVDFGGIMPNPTYAKVQEGARLVRENSIDFILAVGGGSVIDCCKIVSAQAKLDEDIWEMQYTKHRYPNELYRWVLSLRHREQVPSRTTGRSSPHRKEAETAAGWGLPQLRRLGQRPYQDTPDGTSHQRSIRHIESLYGDLYGQAANDNLSDEINEAVMRNVIKNLRALIADPDNDFARGELMWNSALAENSLLKLGKQTDFQCHMLEHAVGAYTDCNHGRALAVIHPSLYRHLLNEGKEKLGAYAERVWNVKGDIVEQTAALGIDALEAFIKEIGLPTRWSELGITDETVLRAAADTCLLMPGCCKQYHKG